MDDAQKKKREIRNTLNEPAVYDYVQSFWGDYDLDKGGTLDRVEIRTFLEDLLGESIEQKTFEKFYDVLDADGDGEIDDMEMI
jgi:Ca2+-binding EF-hand superfamily protein